MSLRRLEKALGVAEPEETFPGWVILNPAHPEYDSPTPLFEGEGAIFQNVNQAWVDALPDDHNYSVMHVRPKPEDDDGS